MCSRAVFKYIVTNFNFCEILVKHFEYIIFQPWLMMQSKLPRSCKYFLFTAYIVLRDQYKILFHRNYITRYEITDRKIPAKYPHINKNKRILQTKVIPDQGP